MDRPRSTIFSAMIFFAWALLLSANSPSQTAQPAWRAQASGVLARLNAVHFIDRQRGWVTGNNGTLLVTEDGGEKWRRVALPEYERQEPVLDVWLFGTERAERGCLLGEYDLFDRRHEIEPNKRAFLLRSDDRGANWKQCELAPPPVKLADKKSRDKTEPPEISPDPVLLRMFFANERAGWACGELGAIQVTKDGGLTWQMQFAANNKIFYDVTAIDEKHAWIAGAGGLVLRTVDGGANWHEQPTGVTAALRAIHFVDAKHGWAVGAGGAILSTMNGGSRWQKQDSGVALTLNDVFFLNFKEGWAAGDRGMLLHTADGGVTWTDESRSTNASLTRIFFFAPARGWVVGSSGMIFSYQAVPINQNRDR